jgi:hypothetical protein
MEQVRSGAIPYTKLDALHLTMLQKILPRFKMARIEWSVQCSQTSRFRSPTSGSARNRTRSHASSHRMRWICGKVRVQARLAAVAKAVECVAGIGVTDGQTRQRLDRTISMYTGGSFKFAEFSYQRMTNRRITQSLSY